METEPQSDQYYQLILDKDQFKKISDGIESVHEVVQTTPDGLNILSMEFDDTRAIPLPEDIRSWQQENPQ